MLTDTSELHECRGCGKPISPMLRLCTGCKARAYRSTPECKAKKRAYQSTPECKAKKRAYRSTPECKAKKRAYQSTPEYKAKKRAYMRTYMKEYYEKNKEEYWGVKT